MKQYPIWKYHANGNDFILIEKESMQECNPQLFALSVCDRHFGIGGDGLIMIDIQNNEMKYYNQDGSNANMCGNGLRCCSYHLVKEHNYPSSFRITTDDGIKSINIIQQEPFLCTIEMGTTSYSPYKTKTYHNKIYQHYPFTYKNMTYYFYTLFMTTIHTIIFVDDFHELSCYKIGKQLCEHSFFTEGTNVNFVKIIDDENIVIKTYERGVGMSNACGSGACASAYLAYHLKCCSNELMVHMDFGKQKVTIQDDDTITSQGSAICVMKGVYYG